MENFFSGSTIANTSTWLGNARPTGGERERRGSRVRLSVRLSVRSFVRLSVTNALLARTNELVPSLLSPPSPLLSLSFSLTRLSVFSGSFCPSFSFSHSLPLSLSLSLFLLLRFCLRFTVPLSLLPSLFFVLSSLSLLHLPLLLVFFFLSVFRSPRTHTL